MYLEDLLFSVHTRFSKSLKLLENKTEFEFGANSFYAICLLNRIIYS